MKRNNRRLNRAGREQFQELVGCIGLLLVGILFLLYLLFSHSDEEVIPEKAPIPVVEVFSNIWIIGSDDTGLVIYHDGKEERYELEQGCDREQPGGNVADITLTDGKITDIQIKSEKINGRIMSVDDTSVEVEGYGVLPLSKDYRGYRIYNRLSMCSSGDLSIGYDFADLVLEDGEVCGILIVKEESMEYIRVLLKTADYAGLLHEEVVFTGDSPFTVSYGSYDNPIQEEYLSGEELTIGMDSRFFEGERIVISPNVLTGKIILKNVHRSQGEPAYSGQIELVRTEAGIAAVNEVLLEEYLYSVVPSEMPSTYPNEALKAQAICARTYAYGHMLKAGYPQYGAHVDDSTSYQVYNNVSEQASTTTAVKETYGRLLYTDAGELAGTYYYSTSCGVGSDAGVWKTEAAEHIDYLKAKPVNRVFLQSVQENPEGILSTEINDLQEETCFAAFITSRNEEDFEALEAWYRWTYEVEQIDAGRICKLMQDRYRNNEKLILTLKGDEYVSKPIESFDKILDISVSKRGAGGIAEELLIVTAKHIYKVISEYNIRCLLNNGVSKVLRQDGSEVSSPTLLPSAFFTLEIVREQENVVGYTLSGGGFGHGVGMSQNAAKQMAKVGYTAEDILLFFFDGCWVRTAYGD